MEKELKRSEDWLKDAKKRADEVAAATQKTSDRKEIGQLKVQAKLVQVEVEEATERIA